MSDNISAAIIGGSAGFKFLQRRNDLKCLGTIVTPFGESVPVHRGVSDGVGFYFMSRHGESGYNTTASFVNYRANIWALKELGVKHIVAWSGPAAIDPSIKIGEIVLPGDLVDETKRRDYTFFDGLGYGFIRQNPVFCGELTAVMAETVVKRQGNCRRDDVYICTEGPRLETSAEIRKFAGYGGGLVGMTLVPEVFLAKELEMCYTMACYVTNYAEGVRERAFREGVLFEGLLDVDDADVVSFAEDEVAEIALTVAVRSADLMRNCKCAVQMERYRRRGDISDDWHTWILSWKS